MKTETKPFKPLLKTYDFKTELLPQGIKVHITKHRFVGKEEHYRYDLVDAKDWGSVATCNVNLPGQLEQGELAIKDYSENEGMLNFLVTNNLVEKPHRYVSSGYVEIPVCKPKDIVFI